MRWFILAACLFLQPGLSYGQESPLESEKQPTVAEKSLNSLQTIAEPLSMALSELEKLKEELAQAPTDDARQEIQNRIDGERERVTQLRENFRSILGGSEAAEYEESNIESASVQDQITELVQPVLSEIREATSEPRELDALRKSLGTGGGEETEDRHRPHPHRRADRLGGRSGGRLRTGIRETGMGRPPGGGHQPDRRHQRPDR